MPIDVSWREHFIPAASHLNRTKKDRAPRIGATGPHPPERTSKPQAQRIAEHHANMQKLGAILQDRKNHRAAEHHPANAHDGKQAAHPHAMMHGPKGGSFYVNEHGQKVYGKK